MSLRENLRDAVAHALEPMDACLALAEGGSAAFGRQDELSDVDLSAFVEDGRIEDVAMAVKAAVLRVAEIEREYVLPQPTWHGAWQAFYKIAGTGSMMVDLCVIERGIEWSLTEVERHGTPVVLFDKEGLVQVTSLDASKNHAAVAEKLARLEATVNMFHGFVDKEIERGNLLDAMHFYQNLVLRPTIDALRAKYDPHRHDFGGRYLYHDLPQDVAQELEALMFVKDAQDLKEKKQRAVALFNASL